MPRRNRIQTDFFAPFVAPRVRAIVVGKSMSIYTRTGDKGQTSLLSGQRVDKDALRVEAYGTLDELNSVLGLARSFCRNARVRALIDALQNELFSAGADLAAKSGRKTQQIEERHWTQQEAVIDQLQEELPPLKNFILPGGSAGAALIHLARSVCRRAERLVVRLKKEEGEVNPQLVIYLNRLSDLLFVMARYENIMGEGQEIIWKGDA